MKDITEEIRLDFFYNLDTKQYGITPETLEKVKLGFAELYRLRKENIKSILTKEQYESNVYKVGE